MAISDHHSAAARGGGQPQWSIDDVQVAIAQQIRNYNIQLEGGPQFSVTQDPIDSSLDVQIDGSSILIVLADDAVPGEFVLLKPYAYKEPPLGGGLPDQQFFDTVREVMKEAVRGELMPGFSLDDQVDASDETHPDTPKPGKDPDIMSDEDFEKFMRGMGFSPN